MGNLLIYSAAEICCTFYFFAGFEEPNHRHRRLLRICGKRPRDSHAAMSVMNSRRFS